MSDGNVRNPHFDDGLILWKDEYSGRYGPVAYEEQFDGQWRLFLEGVRGFHDHTGVETSDEYIDDRIYELTGVRDYLLTQAHGERAEQFARETGRWDRAERRVARRLPLDFAPHHLALDPEGRRLAVNNAETPARVAILELESGSVLADWRSQVGNTNLAWSTDGQLLAIGSYSDDCRVYVWNVRRGELSSVLQGHTSYIVNDRHTLRGGFAVSAEQTNVSNVSTVMPGDIGAVTGPAFPITDQTSLLGWNIGTYIQDEWKVTNQLTINAGLRFDQLYQFVDANQLSPRFAIVYKPLTGTTFHAGYARYFTPPYQAQATQSNIALFANTTNQPDLNMADPVKPERSHYFDAGIDQTVLPGLDMGIDAYYKMAKDMIDDGQFGAAVVLTQFNYARGYSEGAEYKLKYHNGNFTAYANFAYNITRAIDVESNEYLFDMPTYQYLLNHYHYTDDMQRMTGSAGASYRWQDTTFTADMTYGSGLRAGDLSDGVVPNSLHTTPYAVINTGIAHDFKWSPDLKPLTVRFDIVNLFDQVYELRDGSGIGVFAPQYGARRGYYAGISQKL